MSRWTRRRVDGGDANGRDSSFRLTRPAAHRPDDRGRLGRPSKSIDTRSDPRRAIRSRSRGASCDEMCGNPMFPGCLPECLIVVLRRRRARFGSGNMAYGGVSGPIEVVLLRRSGPDERRLFLSRSDSDAPLDRIPWKSSPPAESTPSRAAFHLPEKGDDLVALSIRRRGPGSVVRPTSPGVGVGVGVGAQEPLAAPAGRVPQAGARRAGPTDGLLATESQRACPETDARAVPELPPRSRARRANARREPLRHPLRRRPRRRHPGRTLPPRAPRPTAWELVPLPVAFVRHTNPGANRPDWCVSHTFRRDLMRSALGAVPAALASERGSGRPAVRTGDGPGSRDRSARRAVQASGDRPGRRGRRSGLEVRGGGRDPLGPNPSPPSPYRARTRLLGAFPPK
jgi:hypothetical protein